MTVTMTAVVPMKPPDPPSAANGHPPCPNEKPMPLTHPHTVTINAEAQYESRGSESEEVDVGHVFSGGPEVGRRSTDRSQRSQRSQASLHSKKSVPPTRMQLLQKDLCKWMEPVIRSAMFRVILAISLAIALFGGGFWSICDFPDDPGNIVRDFIMTSVMLLFLSELVMTSVVEYKEYLWSAFFWMDVLGSISMVFEISFLLGSAGKKTENSEGMDTVLLRSARAAKLGARAGRLTKLVKCWQFIFRRRGSDADEKKDRGLETKVMSKRLMQTLSAKVSLLSVVLVLVAPMLQLPVYPEADWSMRAWADRLEADYSRAYNFSTSCQDPSCESSEIVGIFKSSVLEMQAFYDELTYQPYKLRGFSPQVIIDGRTVNIPGASLLHGEAPNRQENIVVQSASECIASRADCSGSERAGITFNFTGPKRIESLMDMLTVLLLVALMGVCSFDLSRTLEDIVVHPLERMNLVLRKHLDKIFSEVSSIPQGGGEDQDEVEGENKTEIELLELVFSKVARLTLILTATRPVEASEMAELDREGKGVIVDMLRLDPVRRRSSVANSIDSSRALQIHEMLVSHLPFNSDKVDDWGLDTLTLEPEALNKVVMYILFDSKLGRATGRAYTEVATFQIFLDVVQQGYRDQHYHNWTHACDVVHSVYYYLTTTSAELWIHNVEQYALLVAALSHDIGHSGRTNPFLVETKHALALRYNDRSPLENMHCATLFEICEDEDADVFSKLDAKKYRKVRKVCVEAILHTDNAGHFDMVKNIQRIYEMASSTCDMQALQLKEEDERLPEYIEDILRKENLFWLEVFLHLADVSNPLMPFSVCKAWAWRVLDEFFDQGDEEKRLGIPVGMLNDRDKVNKPGSQHGFINFLVAPLVFSVVSVFSELHPLSKKMADNLQQWRNLWVEEAKPSKEDVEKRDADVQKIEDKVKALLNRECG